MSELLCPKCGSDQLTANKKGFSGKKAVAGAVLTGGFGLLAGTIGSNKIKITCLSCGNEFKAGQGAKSKTDFKNKKKVSKQGTIGCLALLGILAIIGMFSKMCGDDKNDTAQTEQVTVEETSLTQIQSDFLNSKQEQFTDLIAGNKSADVIKSEAAKLTQSFVSENNGTMTDWEGEIISIDMYKDKELDIAVSFLPRAIVGQKTLNGKTFDCGITIEGGQASSEKHGYVGIPRKGELFEKLSGLTTGDKVVLSAKIVDAMDNTEKTGLNLSTYFQIELTDIRKK